MLGRIKEIAKKYGAAESEIIKAEELDLSIYSKIVEKYPVSLTYLKKTNIRGDIKNFFSKAESILLCLYQYWNSNIEYKTIEMNKIFSHLENTGRSIPLFLKSGIIAGNKIAKYAFSYDYHKKVKEILKKTLFQIQKEFPGTEGKIFVDSSPVVEKLLAVKIGLGWQGKNTLVINKRFGSYFFIGGIALNLKIGKNDLSLQRNLCQDCNKCVLSCPTGALSNYKLNPLKCISYWTTHNKKNFIPEYIAANNHGYIYGCDICQEVCPYNSNITERVIEELRPISE